MADYTGTSNARLTALINSDNTSVLAEGVDFIYGTPSVLTGDASYNSTVTLTSKKTNKSDVTVKYNRLNLRQTTIDQSAYFPVRLRATTLVGKTAQDYVDEINTKLNLNLVASELTTDPILDGSQPMYANVENNTYITGFGVSDTSLAWQSGYVNGVWTRFSTAPLNGVTFHGEVTNFIAYSDLCNQLTVPTTGLYAGVFKDIWMHFTVDGKELYIPRHSVCNNLTYNDLYLKGLVFGTNDNGGFVPTDNIGTPVADTNQLKTITIGADTFKVRLASALPNLTTAVPSHADYTNQLDWSTLSSDITGSELYRVFYPLMMDIQIDNASAVVATFQSHDQINYNGPLLGQYFAGELGFNGNGGVLGPNEWTGSPFVREIVTTGGTPQCLQFYPNALETNIFYVVADTSWLPVLEKI